MNPLRILRWTKSERAAFFEALFSLYCAKICVSLFSFKRVRKIFGNRYRIARSSSGIKEAQIAVLRARRLTPWKRSACLANALVLQSMLAQRGYKTELHLGVTKTPQFSAHAWLQYEGRDLIGGEIKNSYTSIALFETQDLK